MCLFFYSFTDAGQPVGVKLLCHECLYVGVPAGESAHCSEVGSESKDHQLAKDDK